MPCGLRQRGVHAVPQLVGHHEHVVRARRVVQHHVRVRRGHGVRAEGAAALVRARRAVDVAAREELRGHLAELRREGPVAVEHDLLGVRVGNAVVAVRHGGHAVVVGQRVETQQARLQRVPAPRQVVAALDRLDERLDRLVARLVREIARRQPVRVAAQAVLGGLVLEQSVEDERARLEARPQRLGHRRGGLGAPLAVRVLEARQALLERSRLVAVGERHLEGGGLLGEQPLERGAARDVGLREHALLGLGELVRAVAAQRAQVVRGEGELGGGEQLLGTLVRRRVPLQVEEQQLRLDRGAELARLLQQRSARRVRRVERVAQHRVRARAPAEVLDRGQLLHRLRQLRPRPAPRRGPGSARRRPRRARGTRSASPPRPRGRGPRPAARGPRRRLPAVRPRWRSPGRD